MTKLRLGLALAAALALCAPIAAQPVGAPQSITVVDSGTACVTAPTACATYALDSSTGSLSISISGTWTGTLTFEGSNANGVFTALLATNLATAAQATTTTANGLFTVTNAGVITVRVRATAAMTGTATITAAKGLGFARASGALPTAGVLTFGSPADTGLSRTAAATVAVGTGTQGDATGTISVANVNINPALGNLNFSTRSVMGAPQVGWFKLQDSTGTFGFTLKTDALPVYATGFGATTPLVVAGSTAYAGAINTGTGAQTATGTVTFGGTAFPSTPFCQCNSTVAAGACSTDGTSTTVLTMTLAVAPVASSLVRWVCVSPK